MHRTLDTPRPFPARRPLPLGLLGALLAGALLLAAASAAEATVVRLGAVVEEPNECVEPRNRAAASVYCQVFAGDSLEIVALANREDGSVRLAPQPYTLLDVTPGLKPRPLLSFTALDDDDSDDRPMVMPRRNTDYQLRFEGNEALEPGVSAPMIVEVGARLTLPPAQSGQGARLRIPVGVDVPWRSMKGRLQLRRCHRYKATSAASCARRRDYTVIGSRPVSSSGRVVFPIGAPSRSYRRYEVAFRPRSKRFAQTRAAFTVLNGYDGVTSYRPTVRANPFGTR